jgi:hypothetical protein
MPSAIVDDDCDDFQFEKNLERFESAEFSDPYEAETSILSDATTLAQSSPRRVQVTGLSTIWTPSYFIAKWQRLGFLAGDELSTCNTKQAQYIVQIYCNCYHQWDTVLLPLLKLKDALVHSPLSDSNPLCSIVMPLLYPPAKIRGKTSCDCQTAQQVLRPILGLDFILEDFVPVIPGANKSMDQVLLKQLAESNAEVCLNFQTRVECLIQFQLLFNKKPVLYNGGGTSQLALKNLIGRPVFTANASLNHLNGYSGVYVVTGVHPTAAKMNGNKRETSNAIRYGLNVALAVSNTVKAGHHISSYTTHLTDLDIEHQKLLDCNVKWIDSTWGPGAAVGAKAKIFSILHLDLSYMKLLYAAASEHSQDMDYLFKICFACVVTEDLLVSALQLFTHLQIDGLKLWLTGGVRAVLSQRSIVPRFLKVVDDIGSDGAVHFFSINPFTSLSVEKQELVILKYKSLLTKMDRKNALNIMNSSLIASIDSTWLFVEKLLQDFKPESVSTFFAQKNSISSDLARYYSEIVAFIKGVSEDRACVYLGWKSTAGAIKKKGWSQSLQLFKAAKDTKLSRDKFLKLLR